MKKYFLFVLFIFCFLFFRDSYSNNNSDIEKFIENFSIDFENINNNSKNKEKDIYELSEKIIDLDWISGFVLGQYNKTISDKERKEFIKYYSKSLISNYINILGVYKRDSYKILSIEETKRNDVFIVKTKILYNNKQIDNNFRIVKKNNNYFITDIITEGISFISAQRTEINSIISSKGFNNFLKELKNKYDND